MRLFAASDDESETAGDGKVVKACGKSDGEGRRDGDAR